MAIDLAEQPAAAGTIADDARAFLGRLRSWLPPLHADLTTEQLIELVDFTWSRLSRESPDAATDRLLAEAARLSVEGRHQLAVAHAARSLDGALEFAAGELCRRGFERSMVFRVDGAELQTVATRFVTAPLWQDDNHRNAMANPVPLVPELFEALVVGAQVPALVEAPLGDARAWTPIVARMQCNDYVVAPIVVEGRTVGTIHADCWFSGLPLDHGHRGTAGDLAATISSHLERARATPVATLSDREHEVHEAIRRGLSNGAIAHELGISSETVKTYVSRLLRKLDVPNRAAAAGVEIRPPMPTN